MDAVSKEFLAKHGDSFAEGDALHELLAIAAFGKTNTVRLEVLNGYLQRLLRAKANCVVAPDLRVISAEFLLGTIRESAGPCAQQQRSSPKVLASRKAESSASTLMTRRRRGFVVVARGAHFCPSVAAKESHSASNRKHTPHCLRTRRRAWQERANGDCCP